MRLLKKTKGAISIFLCIILLAMIALSGALVDGARMRVAETESKSAVDSAAVSQLTYYDNVLKQLYGLFALSESDAGILNESFDKMLNETLLSSEIIKDKEGFDRYYQEIMKFIKSDKPESLNFFDYKTEDIKVDPVYNLSEKTVFKQQILEFMKYRAPKEIAEQVVDKIMAFKDIGEQTKILDKKLDVDEKLSKASEKQGTLSDKAYDINSLAKNNDIPSRLNNLSTKINEKLNKENQKYNLEKEYSKLTPPQNTSTEDEVSKKAYEQSLKEYNSRKESLEKDLEKVGKEITDISKEADDIKSNLVSHLDNDIVGNSAFSEAKTAITEIKTKSKEAASAANELSNNLSEDTSDFAQSIRTDINSKKQSIDESILDEREEEIQKCQGEYKGVRDIIAGVDYSGLSLDSSGNVPSDIQKKIREKLKIDEIESKLKKVSRVNYYIKKNNEEATKEIDPRDSIKQMKKSMDEAAEKQLEEIKKSDASQKDEFPKEGLPSQGDTVDNIKELKETINNDLLMLEELEQTYSEENNKGDNFNSEYVGDDNFAENADFKKNGIASAKKAFSMMSGISDMISSGLTNMRDELYINEYAMGMFKNSITSKLDSKGQIQYDLTGYRMETRNTTFFDKAEVEYILHGSASQQTNVLWIKGQILLLRWVLNTISIYCDPTKTAFALEIATAISGWTVFGVPVVQTLILFAWSFAESMIDVFMIMEGQDIPIFKMKTDWVIDTTGKGATELAKNMIMSIKDEAIQKAKIKAKEAALNAVDVASDKVADSIQKGISTEIDTVTTNITNSIMKSINQKVDSTVDAVFKPYEDAIYTEIGKVEVKIDELKNIIGDMKNDISDTYEDETDKLMIYINDTIYDTVKKDLPEVQKELATGRYNPLLEELKDHERSYFDEIKKTGTDYIDQKEKALRDKVDKAEAETIGKIKKTIAKSKEKLKENINNAVDKTLGEKLKSGGKNLEEKLNNIVGKKINSLKNSGKENIKNQMNSFFDKLDGKTKGSSLKSPVKSSNLNYTKRTNIKGNMLKMGYTGYLRLFLILTSPEKKLTRIQDLVQLNMAKETGDQGFRLSSCNTSLRFEATVSIKYFFMTSAFMPRNYKDRYKITQIVYKGY